ncbi:DUF6653 family protein [Roseibium sp.]|uniref:DUF6653 family protein n=1 Tax=Roseibium sp. TaxID=1936156 RepID=UPI003A96D8F0
MDPATWQRHASPWSVYSRMATLPLLVLAIWSHTWNGTGFAVIATFAVLIWLWLNPRLFPAPKNTDSWASKATFGERIWLNRLSVPIPEQEARTALSLSLVTGVGFVATIYGAVLNDLLITVPGMIVTYAGKLVFLDKMARLYDRMRNAHPLYRFWSVTPVNDNQRQAQSA